MNANLPTPVGERILALDVLRGFALFGVFVVNASISARPFREVVEIPEDSGPWEVLAWLFLNGAFVTKFVALFSFLFGMGLVLQCERLLARGESPGLYLRRLGWLALFGLLHGFLLFEGDILFPYAVAGGLLFTLRNRSAGFLVRAAIAIYSVGLVLDALATMEPFPEDPEFDALVARAHEQGPLSLVLGVRALGYIGWLWLSSVSLFNWQVVALFFLGAAVMKRGGLPREGVGRIAAGGIVVGTALELASFASFTLDVAVAQAAGTILFSIGSLCLAAGYAATVVQCVQSNRFPRLQRALAAVGRMALTNYVTQSLFLNLIFQSFGLGLWNELTTWEVIGIVCALYALQVAGTSLWLRHFEMGPLEWLWRRLSYSRRIEWRTAL